MEETAAYCRPFVEESQMKIIPGLVTAADIRELLNLATSDLPVVKGLGKGIVLRLLKDGAVTYVYLFDTVTGKYVGVTAVQKDVIGDAPLRVRGVRIFSSGLVKSYQKQGYLWHVIDAIGESNRVFSSPGTTNRGRKMWATRLEIDRKHIYLLHRPKPFNTSHGSLNYVPIRHHEVRGLSDLIWDGSYQTRLIMTRPSDPLLHRLNFGKDELKNIRVLTHR